MREKERDELMLGIDQFSLAFQPIVKVSEKGHTIEAYEILLRYQDGDSFPFEIFEKAINSKECCDHLNAWYEQQIMACLETYPETKFSLNIDFQQLVYVSTWDLLKSLSQYQGRMNIELTEFYQVNNSDHRDVFLKAMNYIKELGMKISFDDVGNGQHSVAFVTENIQHVTSCKLSLLHFNHLEETTAAVLVDLWVKISADFDIKLIVEGVEDKEMADMLTEKGVVYQQGFYWSKAIRLDYPIQNTICF